ncbi:MAG: hypothetical protein K8W52_26235 [Deltaproteobacteria bacterium]|nr:hypothetical protein [Deltaproteobacteria bacterium]
MVRSQFLAVALLASLARIPAAHADDAPPPTTQKLPGGLVLSIDNYKLFVSKGKVRAPISLSSRMGDDDAFEGISKAVIDTAGRKVAVTLTEPCHELDHTFNFDQLEARLANIKGLTAHRKKDYAGAATAFAAAVKLDPTFNLAAENLASALALGGKPDEAVAALAPWIASDPVWVYERVAADPELASLRKHATITALAAKKKGTALLKDDAVVGDVAYSEARNELAVVRVESSWGAGGWVSEVEIFDAKTGALRTVLPLVGWGDTAEMCDDDGTCLEPGRARLVKKRVATLQGVLRDFGFSPVKSEKGGGVKHPHENDDTQTISFARGKVGIASNGGSVNVLRGNTVLASGTADDRLERASLVAAPKAVVIWSGRTGREGCEGTDPTEVTVIPLP